LEAVIMNNRRSFAVLAVLLLAIGLPLSAESSTQTLDPDAMSRVLMSSRALAAQSAPEPTLEALRGQAQERMRADLKAYSPQQLREIEDLYQSANRDLRAPEARATLQQLVTKYPKSNRTGCAVLYLAQQSTGGERESFLKMAIADHADARYGDGVQVGALARVILAELYLRTGRMADAQKLAEEVTTLFPGAVDHNGGRLVESLRRLKLSP
jgi:hypothetical protein